MGQMLEINAEGAPTFSLSDLTQFTGNGNERFGFGTTQDGNGPTVIFYPRSIQNNAASLQQGKPIFRACVFVKVMQPGERDVVDRQATRDDAVRWPQEYRRYLEGREDIPEGIPLAVLFPHHADIVQALQYHRVHTVEQLAKLSDTQKQNLGMGGYEWATKAQRYLSAMASGEGFAKLDEELRRQRVYLEQSRANNEQLAAEVSRLTQQLASVLSTQATAPGAGLLQQQGPYMPQPAAPAPIGGGIFVPTPAGELGADDNVMRHHPRLDDIQAEPPAPNIPFHEDIAAAADVPAEPPAPEASADRRKRRQ